MAVPALMFHLGARSMPPMTRLFRFWLLELPGFLRLSASVCSSRIVSYAKFTSLFRLLLYFITKSLIMPLSGKDSAADPWNSGMIWLWQDCAERTPTLRWGASSWHRAGSSSVWGSQQAAGRFRGRPCSCSGAGGHRHPCPLPASCPGFDPALPVKA